MKKLFIMLIILTIVVSPALARMKCTPYMKKYWRSNSGSNEILVGWQCKGSGNSFSIRTTEICAVAGDGEVICAEGYKNLTIRGKSTKLSFGQTTYPIERVFIKK